MEIPAGEYASKGRAMESPIYLDVMKEGRFVCQLRYTRRGFPTLIGGKVVEVHDLSDMEAFVYEQRPSLRGKDIKIAFSSHKVLTH